MVTAQHESRTRLLDAALDVFRAKGYTATRVEDICAAAGLTKGSFFHHFKTKDELAIAAAGRLDRGDGRVVPQWPITTGPPIPWTGCLAISRSANS